MPPKCYCCGVNYGRKNCSYGRCEGWICDECDVGGLCHPCAGKNCPKINWKVNDMPDKEEVVPIEWDMWEEIDVSLYQFFNVTFYKPFSSIKIGTKAPIVCIDYGKGVVEVYDEDNNITHHIEFIGTPVSEKKLCDMCNKELTERKCKNRYCDNWICGSCPSCHP